MTSISRAPGLLVASVFAAFYVLAAAMMISEPGDHAIHLDFARRLAASYQPEVPHFLYHLLVATLAIATPLTYAGAALAVLGIAQAATAIIVYRYAAPILRFPWIAVAAALFAQPIVSPLGRARYTIGYLWSSVYHSPTYTLMQPFAILSFFLAWQFLVSSRSRKSIVALSAVAVVAGALAKPSFLICLLPAVLVLSGWKLLRHEEVDRRGLLFGILLPGILVLAAQFAMSFSGQFSGGYQSRILVAPLKVLHLYSGWLAVKLVLSVSFPLSVWIVYRKEAAGDTMLRLATLIFTFGAAYAYLLAESRNWQHGNLLWSSYIGLFTLYVASAFVFFRQVESRPKALRHLVPAFLLLLHVRSGFLMYLDTVLSAPPHWGP